MEKRINIFSGIIIYIFFCTLILIIILSILDKHSLLNLPPETPIFITIIGGVLQIIVFLIFIALTIIKEHIFDFRDDLENYKKN